MHQLTGGEQTHLCVVNKRSSIHSMIDAEAHYSSLQVNFVLESKNTRDLRAQTQLNWKMEVVRTQYGLHSKSDYGLVD